MEMNRRAKKPAQRLAKASSTPKALPLIEHVRELRRRLFYVAGCVVVGSLAAYAVQSRIVSVLLRPSHGQHFIYTSPLGGINFLFSVCLDVGLVIATPVIIYQVLAFLQPIMRDTTRRFLILSATAAGIVAVGGVTFGYYVGLPSTLHLLLHQFTTIQIRPLITIQSYMQFVALYLLGSALMFQLPLILIIINRIKPLKPSGLLKYERHLIAGAFIIAFIMDPTPNIIGQMVVVVPVILMYQVGIFIIWRLNKYTRRPAAIMALLEQDFARQAARAQKQLEPFVAVPAYGPDVSRSSSPEGVAVPIR